MAVAHRIPEPVKSSPPPNPNAGSAPGGLAPLPAFLEKEGFAPAHPEALPQKVLVFYGLERGPGVNAFLHRIEVRGGKVLSRAIRTWDIRPIQIEKVSTYMTFEDLR